MSKLTPNMCHTSTNRLWTAYFDDGRNIKTTGIIAPDAAAAAAIAEENKEVKVKSLLSEPIYENSVQVSCGNGAGDNENAVFEITIKGTSRGKVFDFKNALALMIGGKEVDEKYGSSTIDRIAFAKQFCRDINMTVTAF